MLIGISGQARSGKDTVADFLVPNNMVKVAFADPMKRIAMDVYGLSIEQCWGDLKEVPDKRYPTGKFGEFKWLCDPCTRAAHGDVFEEKTIGRLGPVICAVCDETVPYGRDAHMVPEPLFLTPRKILQHIGTEMGRELFPNTWVDYLLRVIDKLLNDREYDYNYTGPLGLFDKQRKEYVAGKSKYPPMWDGVLVPDMRFQNEIDGLRVAGAKLIRVKRPGSGLQGEASKHKSETEQDDIPDSAFDVVIHNTGTLEELHLQAEVAFRELQVEEQTEKAAEAFKRVLEGKSFQRIRDMEFFPHPDGVREIKMPLGIPAGIPIADDGTELLPGGPLPSQSERTMQDLLDRRAADVKAGKILEYDAEQRDVPPMLRKKP